MLNYTLQIIVVLSFWAECSRLLQKDTGKNVGMKPSKSPGRPTVYNLSPDYGLHQQDEASEKLTIFEATINSTSMSHNINHPSIK